MYMNQTDFESFSNKTLASTSQILANREWFELQSRLFLSFLILMEGLASLALLYILCLSIFVCVDYCCFVSLDEPEPPKQRKIIPYKSRQWNFNDYDLLNVVLDAEIAGEKAVKELSTLSPALTLDHPEIRLNDKVFVEHKPKFAVKSDGLKEGIFEEKIDERNTTEQPKYKQGKVLFFRLWKCFKKEKVEDLEYGISTV